MSVESFEFYDYKPKEAIRTLSKRAMIAITAAGVLSSLTINAVDEYKENNPIPPHVLDAAEKSRENSLVAQIRNSEPVSVLSGTIVEQVKNGTKVTPNPIVVDDKPLDTLGANVVEEHEKFHFYSRKISENGELTLNEIDTADKSRKFKVLGSPYNEGEELLWSGVLSQKARRISSETVVEDLVIQLQDDEPGAGELPDNIQIVGETSFKPDTAK